MTSRFGFNVVWRPGFGGLRNESRPSADSEGNGDGLDLMRGILLCLADTKRKGLSYKRHSLEVHRTRALAN
jgi:hypothetical protein